jgi:hypothetical protein
MLLRLVSSPLAILLLVLAVGCNGRAAHPDGAPIPGGARSIRLIGRGEILASPARDAEDLLQRVRPQLLLPRALRGRGVLAYATPIVYVNDVRQGGIDVLRLVPVSSIAEIIYLPSVEADNALVGLHPAGAIVIRTRVGLPQ